MTNIALYILRKSKTYVNRGRSSRVDGEHLVLQAAPVGHILHAIYEVVSIIMVFFKGVGVPFVCRNSGIIILCILRVVL